MENKQTNKFDGNINAHILLSNTHLDSIVMLIELITN